MRYQSSLPLRARSGSSSCSTNPLAIRRAQPTTCVLSLASVTVSMAPTENSTEQAATSVEPTPVAMPTSRGADVVPFPTSSKRTHSLLRATPGHVRQASQNAVASTSSDPGESSSLSDPDFSPPRKRTRTCALSSSSRPRVQRSNATPIRIPAPPHLSGGAPAESSALPPPPSVPLCTALMSPRPCIGTAGPLASAPLRRRRWSPGDLRVQLYLYRTLVYGLEIRYPNLLSACEDITGKDGAAACLYLSNEAYRLYFFASRCLSQ